jgi:hypothetical protein
MENNNNENLSRDEILRNKRQKGLVGFHKFLLKYKPHKNIPYCFVEGEDAKYYGPRVTMVCHKEPDFIRCNGKKGVIKAYEEIIKHQEYNEVRLFFFVDRDFDEPLNNPKIYETPCYSVENLYSSPKVLERILKHEFNLEETDVDFKNAMDTFLKRQKEFHDNIALLNAWIACCKEYMSKTKKEIKLRLNNLSFKEHLIDVSLEKVTAKYTIEKIEEFLEIPVSIPASVLENKLKQMNSHPMRGRIFRGKFEIAFFISILDKLIEDRNKKEGRKVFQNKGKVRLPLDVNPLTVLSIYADVPDCLYDYIEKQWLMKSEMQHTS